MASMDEQCRAEVVGLHRFFEDWFTGRLDPTDDAFRRFSDVLAHGFELISPRGERLDRDAILERVRSAHGGHRAHADACRIRIESCRGRPLGGGLHLVTYEEWQELAGDRQARLSTAVFRRKPSAPNGVVWLHVHEVWLGGES